MSLYQIYRILIQEEALDTEERAQASSSENDYDLYCNSGGDNAAEARRQMFLSAQRDHKK